MTPQGTVPESHGDLVKTDSGTWKAVIRKAGWPTTAKTFRTKRDAEDWSRCSEDEMVRGAYIQRATADRMTVSKSDRAARAHLSEDGSVCTSAGITAGIDLCLALVEEDHGHQVALNVARFLVMFLVRPGGQAQYSHMLLRQAVTSKPLRELQVWMLENLREDLTVDKLADRLGMSARQFTRVCLRETKMNPGQFVDRMRVEAAQQLIGQLFHGAKEIADTSGFQSADSMRRTFLRVLGVSAAEYATRFSRQPRFAEGTPKRNHEDG